MNSFLHPKVSCVNVFRSLSCSQSIRQRIRRRAVTVYFNLHGNFEILVYGSQDKSNLTSFHHCLELRFFTAQGCQALKCGTRFHGVVTNLSHKSRRTLPRDRVASKIAVHEDCDLVNMFLSSKSQRSVAFPNQISRCTFVEQNRIHDSRSFSGPNALQFQQGLI